MTLKQVFIVNSGLKMGKGKIAVQVAHGETLSMETMNDYTNLVMVDDKESQMIINYSEWMKDGLMKKVALKATQEEMLMIIGAVKCLDDTIWFDVVFDKGLTQVPADSMTCIVFEPLNEKEADVRFGHLKLL